MSSKESIEKEALKTILEAGEEGILQSELWKKLGVSSREGSRIARKFEEKGKISRERVLSNGRYTYRLVFKKVPVTLDSVKDVPCLVCEEIDKCFPGGTFDPTTCLKLTNWIDPRRRSRS